jgi:uncharacterized protein
VPTGASADWSHRMSTQFLHAENRKLLLRWWGWLALTALLLEIVVAARYYEVADLDASPASLLFRAAMLVAHFATVTLIALSPLLALILAWPRPRLVIPLGVVWAVALLAALLVDTQVYLLYRFHINAGVLNLLFGGAARETFVFPRAMYLQAAAIAAAVALIFAIAGGLCWRYVRGGPGRHAVARAIAVTLGIALLGFHGVHIWAAAVGYEPLLEQTDVLPMRYATTANRLLRRLNVNVHDKGDVVAHSSQDRSLLSYPLRPLHCRAPEKSPNIVVILIDSWRYNELNASVTPAIDAFARRSVRFMDHYSGGNATRIGVFSLFYSIPGTYWHRVLAERQGPVFIDQLLEQNYDVRVFRSAPLHSPEFDKTVFAQLDDVRMRSDGDRPAQWDRDLTDDFVGYLDSRSAAAPFFALLFYDAPHSFDYPEDYPAPFQPAAKQVNYLTLNQGTDRQPLLNRYRNSLHYVDSLVAKSFAALETRGLLENSVIVVTGDHGQEFNDNLQNYWGHSSNFTRYQTGVPFLLYAPELEARVYRHRTTHFDVMPSLMRDYLGCADPFSTHSVGRPLFEPGGREPMILSEYADFAIMHADRIAVIRKHGMEVRGAGYTELDARLDPKVIASALEQKTRFYKATPRGAP